MLWAKGSSGAAWSLHRETGSAADLHAGSAAALNTGPVRRTLRILAARSPALVVGSHQDASAFDGEALAAAGVELARRRSGGSAVLVGPGRVLWVDFLIPAGDPLWADDVGRAAWWVGEVWAAAIGGAAEVWRGAMHGNDWSPLVCFAGLAPGEVTVGGRKVVGVCQRRTPGGALFQTAGLIEWDPAAYVALIRRPPGPLSALAGLAAGLGDGARVEAALISALMQ